MEIPECYCLVVISRNQRFAIRTQGCGQHLVDMRRGDLSGRIHSTISKPFEALNAYQQARTEFLFLGDTQRAAVLDRRINKLKTQ